MAPATRLNPGWSHQSNMTFILSFTSLYPHGYGADTTAFEFPVSMGGPNPRVVEFVAINDEVVGFGYFDYNDGLVQNWGTVKQRAYAWFDRIGNNLPVEYK
jgi:hypothetical protein